MRKIGRYEVEAEIGRGGMGTVLRGRDPALGRRVAIKLLLGFQNPKKRRRFQTEVQTLAKIRHPNVVGIHASGTTSSSGPSAGVHEGVPYLVMDWVDGESLQERIDSQGPLDPREAAHKARDLTSALAAVHAQGVLHRDLKPSNVLLAPDGTPLLTDFGLAKDLDQQLSGSMASVQGAFLGTPGFLPPEQARGELSQVGPRSDIYGMGATLYAMLTGQAPYTGDRAIEILAAMDSPPPSPSKLRPGLDSRLVAICMRCLQNKPALRYPDAHALVADLDAFLAGRGGRSKLAPALVAITVLCAAAWGLVGLTRRPQAGVTLAAPAHNPSEVDSGAGSIEAMLAAQRWAEAEEALDAALAEAPEAAELYLLRSRARRMRGDGVGAEADASSAIALASDDPAGRVARARIRADRGDWEGALDDADRVIELEPSAEHHLLRSRLRAGIGDPEGAITDATAAIIEDSRLATAYAERGSHWHALDDLERAEADYVRALELDPSEWGARRNLGVMLLALERWGDALPLLSETVGFDRAEAVDWLHLGTACRWVDDFQRALESFRRAQELDPAQLQPWVERGVLLLAGGRFEEAIADLDQAARLAPDEPQIFFKRGVAYSSLRDPAAALVNYERALELAPGDYDARFNHAESLRTLGRLPEAEAGFSALLQRRPDDAQALEIRYRVRRELGEADGALSDLEALSRLQPGELRHLELRYSYLTELRRPEQALLTLDAWITAEPQRGFLLMSRALLRAGLGRVGDAIEDAERVAEAFPDPLARVAGKADPTDARYWHLQGVSSRRQKVLGDALVRLTWSLHFDDERWEVWAERALARRDAGDVEGGLADIDHALGLAPEEAFLHYHRSDLLSRLKRVIPSRESLAKALELDPEFAAAWFMRGSDLESDDPESSIAAYERVLELEPDHQAALHNVSIALLEQGRFEECLVHSNHLVTLSPDDIEPRLTRARALIKLGDADGALEDYAFGQRAYPGDWRAWVGGGQLLRAEGRYVEADRALSRALALQPDHPVLLMQRAFTLNALEEWGRANADYAAYLELRPDRHDMRLKRVRVLEHLGLWQEALDECLRVVEAGRESDVLEAEERIVELRRKLAEQE